MSEKETVKQEAGMVITAEMLKEIIATAIAAAKAPNAVEQKQLDQQEKEIEEQQKNRRLQAEQVKQEGAAKKYNQRTCSHEHADGHTHGVYVQERTGPGYILCQLCQGVLRPGVEPAGYKGSAIFDNTQFIRIFQKLNSNKGDILG